MSTNLVRRGWSRRTDGPVSSFDEEMEIVPLPLGLYDDESNNVSYIR